MDTTVADPLIGALLDRRYEIRDRLATGGMATVYAAIDRRLDRPVAVKIMHPAFVGDPLFVARFHREAKSAAQLSTPYAVAVTDQGTDRSPAGDRVFLVMELVPGPTLRRRLTEQGPLPVAEAAYILESVLRALAAAHRVGVVHRDVKPENVLLGLPTAGAAPMDEPDGPDLRWQVKVADFGLARAVESSPLTAAAGLLLGTVAYLAPELVTSGAGDARADVYAAGILLYEMLTGRPPHDADTPLAVAYRHVNADVPAPSRSRPDIPAALDSLVLAATARDPQRRPPDAAALLDTLVRARSGMQLRGRRATRPIPLSERHTDLLARQPAAPGREPSGPPPTARGHGWAKPEEPGRAGRAGKRRRRYPWVIVAILAALIAGGVSWWLAAGRYAPVPQLIGMDRATATRTVTDAHLSVAMEPGVPSETVATGNVAEQTPQPGTSLTRGGRVHLRLSLGPERFTVPDLTGMSLDDARTALQANQLAVGQLAYAYDDTVPPGKVVRCDPPTGSGLPRGSPVNLTVSSGPETLLLPDVVGQPMSQARSQLESMGLQVRAVSLPGSDPLVLGQSPDGGRRVAPGTTVSLFGI